MIYDEMVCCLLVFLAVEGLVVRTMTAEPMPGLDYIVVLGAGVVGIHYTVREFFGIIHFLVKRMI